MNIKKLPLFSSKWCFNGKSIVRQRKNKCHRKDPTEILNWIGLGQLTYSIWKSAAYGMTLAVELTDWLSCILLCLDIKSQRVKITLVSSVSYVRINQWFDKIWLASMCGGVIIIIQFHFVHLFTFSRRFAMWYDTLAIAKCYCNSINRLPRL